MSGREGPGTARRAARGSARSSASAGSRPWPLTLATAAGLGLLLYVATTSLPYLIASPASDANLGALNHCLSQVLAGATRLGWAVAPDASRAAVFGPRVVAVCDQGGARTRLDLPGATAMTFDGANRLWVAAGHRLLREEGGVLRPVGDFSPPVALAGHGGGVLALDASGQLVSVAPDGSVLGQVMLPGPGARLSVGPGGLLAAVLWEGWVLSYDARTLAPLRAESLCFAESLWWLDTPERVLIACAAGTGLDAGTDVGAGPAPGLALTLDLRTGGHEVAPPGQRTPARRLPGRPFYVHGCDGFPCTAPPP